MWCHSATLIIARGRNIPYDKCAWTSPTSAEKLFNVWLEKLSKLILMSKRCATEYGREEEYTTVQIKLKLKAREQAQDQGLEVKTYDP